MAMLEIRDLTFRYAGSDADALRGVTLAVEEGGFAVIFGPSGSGKSTLLRCLKPAVAPAGERSGSVLLDSRGLFSLSERELASDIGYVTQDAGEQTVTDRVLGELCFGLESLGVDNADIRRRVAEICAFFGIEDWLRRDVSTLSGGEKQLLNLASVMVMRPRLLLLDEPTAQLDPVAAASFLSLVRRVNEELGTTVVVAEHRLDEIAPAATFAAAMSDGAIAASGGLAEVSQRLYSDRRPEFSLLPASARITLSACGGCALSVAAASSLVAERAKDGVCPLPPRRAVPDGSPTLLFARDVRFRYDKTSPDVLSDFSADIRAGEWIALLGANGAGKSTALSVLAGVARPYAGKVVRKARCAMLTQDAKALFTRKTVFDELLFAADGDEAKALEVAATCRLERLLSRHPFDLSGGETQLLALAIVLLSEPDVLLLDEPTKGLDPASSERIARILDGLALSGRAVVTASHDADLCAAHATRCLLLFDGSVAVDEPTVPFFRDNAYFTTAARRIAGDAVPDAITADEVVAALTGKTPDLPDADPDRADDRDPDRTNNDPDRPADTALTAPEAPKRRKLPLWRLIFGISFAVAAAAILAYAAFAGELTEFSRLLSLDASVWRTLAVYAALILCFAASALFFTAGRSPSHAPSPNDGAAASPGAFSVLVALAAVPAAVYLGWRYLDTGRYYLTATAILVLCTLPFFISYERSRPKARDLVTVAALCALGVAARAAFYMVPQFKPVLALCVLTGAAFGAETGFLVGSVTMLSSNLLFSQGPWTPWQMYAMGLVGFLAGVFCRSRAMKRRGALAAFGAICAVVVYGGIMNPAAALIWDGDALDAKILAAYYVTGFGLDLVHAAASFIFLWTLSAPMLEKFERLKTKYNVLVKDKRERKTDE